MDLKVTLVIKAPNQRVDDHTVDCMLGWTVKMLKQHLTDVYPSKPKETQQKLIYSGKLLQDHLTLKDILREFDDGSTRHTVHLVCSFSPQSESRLFASSSKKSPTMTPEAGVTRSRQSSSASDLSQSPSNTSQTDNSGEGLRHRGHNHVHTNPSTSVPSTNVPNMFNPYSAYPNQTPLNPMMNQFAGGLPAEAAMLGGMMPGASGMVYSPEQYVWMQQMYTQYMAQYMQYYQQTGFPTPPNTPVTPTPSQGADVPNPAEANEADNQNVAAEADGDEMEDLDEDFRPRDWLDYLYTFSRFMVLLGIVYFYSSLTRFLMVGVFFLGVYAYQMGWFMLRLNRRPRQPAQNGGNENNEQPQGEDNQPQANIPNENADQGAAPAPEEAAAAPPAEPPAPTVLQVTMTFICTFFTSLFPAPPQRINAN